MICLSLQLMLYNYLMLKIPKVILVMKNFKIRLIIAIKIINKINYIRKWIP